MVGKNKNKNIHNKTNMEVNQNGKDKSKRTLKEKARL